MGQSLWTSLVPSSRIDRSGCFAGVILQAGPGSLRDLWQQWAAHDPSRARRASSRCAPQYDTLQHGKSSALVTSYQLSSVKTAAISS